MIDRLIEEIRRKKNPSVVGLDPTMEMMPGFLKEKYLGDDAGAEAVAAMFAEFNRSIIDAVADIVPAVKPQIAMYERFGEPGIRTYNETCRYAEERGLLVIGDVKRGDISSTAAAYAAHVSRADIDGRAVQTWWEDAVTVNPYLGVDGIRPFTEAMLPYEKGMFVLVRTSNPGSAQLQELELSDGRRVYEAVADLVESWGSECIGRYGYSEVGAVVGATHREQGEQLRPRMKHTFFLVPGYGAQGGTADDVAGFFDEEGLGAIISSSRGITAAYRKMDDLPEQEYAEAAARAAGSMKNELNRALNQVYG